MYKHAPLVCTAATGTGTSGPADRMCGSLIIYTFQTSFKLIRPAEVWYFYACGSKQYVRKYYSDYTMNYHSLTADPLLPACKYAPLARNPNHKDKQYVVPLRLVIFVARLAAAKKHARHARRPVFSDTRR